ncbi:hypothetical protein BHE74_00004021 [Ensete ventricosum]|nr:hypothetical protein BHE74_00004021 [Ensete ventricosum]
MQARSRKLPEREESITWENLRLRTPVYTYVGSVCFRIRLRRSLHKGHIGVRGPMWPLRRSRGGGDGRGGEAGGEEEDRGQDQGEDEVEAAKGEAEGDGGVERGVVRPLEHRRLALLPVVAIALVVHSSRRQTNGFLALRAVECVRRCRAT